MVQSHTNSVEHFTNLTSSQHVTSNIRSHWMPSFKDINRTLHKPVMDMCSHLRKIWASPFLFACHLSKQCIDSRSEIWVYPVLTMVIAEQRPQWSGGVAVLSRRAATVGRAGLGLQGFLWPPSPLSEIKGSKAWGLTDPGGLLAFTSHLYSYCLRNVIFSPKLLSH